MVKKGLNFQSFQGKWFATFFSWNSPGNEPFLGVAKSVSLVPDYATVCLRMDLFSLEYFERESDTGMRRVYLEAIIIKIMGKIYGKKVMNSNYGSLHVLRAWN